MSKLCGDATFDTHASVDHILAVYSLMLKEAKLVFVSCSSTLLTEVS